MKNKYKAMRIKEGDAVIHFTKTTTENMGIEIRLGRDVEPDTPLEFEELYAYFIGKVIRENQMQLLDEYSKIMKKTEEIADKKTIDVESIKEEG